MALRQIRTQGDDILAKECRKVEKMTPKIRELIDDMFDTMYEAYGVGLAAPQVGILKQIVVIDTTGEDPIVLINPEIIETSGSQTGEEGCLSVPGMSEELLARAICHETDHLLGRLYTELVEGELHRTNYEEDEE